MLSLKIFCAKDIIMNSKENILETIKLLKDSFELLNCNAMVLASLVNDSTYGERITKILDGIQVHHGSVAALANECLDKYQQRYGESLNQIEDLTKQLRDELE